MSLPLDEPEPERGVPTCAIYRLQGEPMWRVRFWNGRGWERRWLLATSVESAKQLCPKGWRVLVSLDPR